jgi:carbohydrate-selective porin OprB
VFGAEPYVTDVSVDGSADPSFSDDIPFHIEAFYRYPLSDRLFITPGLIWLTSPNQNADNDDVFIGVLRTTFKF